MHRRQRLATKAATLHCSAAAGFFAVIEAAKTYEGAPAGKAMVQAMAAESQVRAEDNLIRAYVMIAYATIPLRWYEKVWDFLQDWWEEAGSAAPQGENSGMYEEPPTMLS